MFHPLFAEVSTWNSLEVAKLVVSALTPLAVLVLGVRFQKSLKAIEEVQWVNQRVIEWKINTYQELAPMLNTLYCYFTHKGDFKDHDPPSVVNLKRKLDKTVSLMQPLYGQEFLTQYNLFINMCFDIYTGLNRDARMKTGFASRKESWGTNWHEEWEQLFVEEEQSKSDRGKLEEAYRRVMESLASELNLRLNVEKAGQRS